MITLEIKHADGALYWTEYFQTGLEALKWLNEEKTRPYWKTDFIVNILDNTADVQTQIENAKQESRRQRIERKNRKDAIKAFMNLDERDIKQSDLIRIVKHLADIVGLDEETNR